MRRGDTFVIKKQGLDNHLWIIASCPEMDAARILCVNVTTYDKSDPTKDPACILKLGEHKFLTKPESCIYYAEPKVVSLDDLLVLLDSKLIEKRDPMSGDIMQRIYAGAESTSRIKIEDAAILESQGWIAGDLA